MRRGLRGHRGPRSSRTAEDAGRAAPGARVLHLNATPYGGGVAEILRSEVPDLKLALVGSMALDDPEGWEVYRQIKEAASEDPDIDIFTNLTGVSNVEVNAFQRFSDVCVQKSIREGFGLVVSETLWKGTPMVAGEAGGIPMQMPGGTGGFLVGSVKECAERLLYLLRNPKKAHRCPNQGRKS